MALLVAIFLAIWLVVSACASPHDVRTKHAEELANYRGDLARAEEWNNHVLGIPGSGWLGIIMLACVLGAFLLVLAGIEVAGALGDRRSKRHQLDLEREKTAQVTAERGACKTCGAPPTVDLRELREVEAP